MVINAETEERMVRGQRVSRVGWPRKPLIRWLVQPSPPPAGVSGDRQVKMTDDTGLERRAGEGSTRSYWGTGQRGRGTMENGQESPESHRQNAGFLF